MIPFAFSLSRLPTLPLLMIAAAVCLTAQAPVPALRIVVIEGENAVNVVQQKSAVAPVVEVRDRNDQPVAGALVRFAIQGGRATFGNARTLTVTTNTAGRAVAAGLTPTGNGALQISATASFQGQTTAAVTIAQTNVMTATQAAAMSSAGGAGGGAGGATGGGLPLTTIGVVGGAAVAGTLVTRQLLGGFKYNTTISGTLRMTFPGAGISCTIDEVQTGTFGMDLTDNNGTITGVAGIDGDIVINANTCNPNAPPNVTDTFGVQDIQVTGTPSSVVFNSTSSNTFVDAGGVTGTASYTASFVGTFNGSEVAGVLTLLHTITDRQNPPGTGTVVYNLTLR